MPTALVAATGGARLRGRERQHAAVELRKAGASLDEIAKALGYSNRASVHNAITAVMARWDAEAAPEMIKLEAARLDTMQRALSPKVMLGDPEAIRAALRIMDRRAKLYGLDRNETREADAIEAMAITYTVQVQWLQQAMTAILAQLSLTFGTNRSRDLSAHFVQRTGCGRNVFAHTQSNAVAGGNFDQIADQPFHQYAVGEQRALHIGIGEHARPAGARCRQSHGQAHGHAGRARERRGRCREARRASAARG